MQVVELVEVPEEPVLDDEARVSDLAGDVGVGDRRRLAFRYQLGEVARVDAGVAERIAVQVEVVGVAEAGDVGRGRRPLDRLPACRLLRPARASTGGLPSTVETLVGSYCSAEVSQGGSCSSRSIVIGA